MKRIARSIFQAGYHQLRKIYRLSKGEPLSLSFLSSQTLDEDDVEVAQYWLQNRDAWYSHTPVLEYEKKFAEWNGSSYAFSFMGGRVALSAIIHALALKPGDEVIIPGYTCVVVPNAFHYEGIKTVYCDIELETYGLDAALLEAMINPQTKAIVIHHLYGLVCRDYEKLISVAQRYGLYVIEDCAHSTGATYKGVNVGNLGDVAFFSSEQSKVFTTIQGGIAVTNNPDIAAKIKEYSEKASFPSEERIDSLLHSVLLNYYRFKHPQRWWRGDWAHVTLGHKELVSTTKGEEQGQRPFYYGEKMPAPLASLGINQLNKLDTYNQQRRETAHKWDLWCTQHGYKTPYVVPDSVPVYLRYPVLVEPEKKEHPGWARKEMGVELGLWFVTNVHPADWLVENCPNADLAVRQCINFPGIIS